MKKVKETQAERLLRITTLGGFGQKRTQVLNDKTLKKRPKHKKQAHLGDEPELFLSLNQIYFLAK